MDRKVEITEETLWNWAEQYEGGLSEEAKKWADAVLMEEGFPADFQTYQDRIALAFDLGRLTERIKIQELVETLRTALNDEDSDLEEALEVQKHVALLDKKRRPGNTTMLDQIVLSNIGDDGITLDDARRILSLNESIVVDVVHRLVDSETVEFRDGRYYRALPQGQAPWWECWRDE